jgi:hypothetical protein
MFPTSVRLTEIVRDHFSAARNYHQHSLTDIVCVAWAGRTSGRASTRETAPVHCVLAKKQSPALKSPLNPT